VKNRLLLLLAITCYFVTGNIYAHNTTQIHPRISIKALELIKNNDQAGKYGELYRESSPDNYLFWGRDMNPVTENYGGYDGRSVIGGVVMEDAPNSRVLNHFFHAKTGRQLTIPVIDVFMFNERPSNVVATEFFNRSLEIYGYNESTRSGTAEPDKPLGYWFFGRAMHHLEDMNSPAHVHNDAHLVTGNAQVDITLNEHDDYEGIYLPPVRNSAPVVNFFSGLNIQPITDLSDIWSTTNPNALSLIVYKAVRYQGILEYPSTLNPLASEPTYPNGRGELAAMFPNGGLHWNRDLIIADHHWEINGVGSYYYGFLNRPYGYNSWWPTTDEGDDEAGFFYIEQTAGLIPNYMRPELLTPYVEGVTVMQPNSRLLTEIYAQKLLPFATEYAAGFAQYWYKIVNLPPYLKKVTVRQDGNDVYRAKWLDELQTKAFEISGPTYVSSGPDDENFSYAYVSERALLQEINPPKHIHGRNNVILVLEFNEAVKVWDGDCPQGGFYPDFFLEINGRNMLTNGTYCQFSRRTEDGAGEEYTIVIPQANLADLNGKLRLTVRANDKDDHLNDFGSGLDANPGTPAYRRLDQPGYPWHSLSTIGRDGVTGSNSYDIGGDQTHYLLFDTTPPISAVTTDPAQ